MSRKADRSLDLDPISLFSERLEGVSHIRQTRVADTQVSYSERAKAQNRNVKVGSSGSWREQIQASHASREEPSTQVMWRSGSRSV